MLCVQCVCVCVRSVCVCAVCVCVRVCVCVVDGEGCRVFPSRALVLVYMTLYLASDRDCVSHFLHLITGLKKCLSTVTGLHMPVRTVKRYAMSCMCICMSVCVLVHEHVVCVCVRVHESVSVCVCGSLHCMNEIVTLLNFTLFICNSLHLANCNFCLFVSALYE